MEMIVQKGPEFVELRRRHAPFWCDDNHIGGGEEQNQVLGLGHFPIEMQPYRLKHLDLACF